MWLSSLFPRRGRAPARPRRRPTLEALEGRLAPATLTVTSATDSGPGTLRAELVAAAPGDTVVFDPGLAGQTITLTGGPLTLTKDVTITGPGAGLLSVSGGGASRVLEVPNGVTAAISGLTVRDGLVADVGDPLEPAFGGGILNHGALTLTDCEVRDNQAVNGGAGGGVYSDGALLAVNCFIHDNQVSAAEFGADGRGAGVYSDGTAGLTDCTISNNTGVSTIDVAGLGFAFGGGLFNDAAGALTVIDCTVTDNQLGGGAGEGAGIQDNGTAVIRNSTIAFNQSDGESGGINTILRGTRGTAAPKLQLFDTIVAQNTAHSNPDVEGAVDSLGHNLVGDPTGATGLVASDLQGLGVPGIHLLGDHGGPTVALDAGSPAVNAGDPAEAPATDARGFNRIVDGAIDIGAFEFQPPAVTVALASSANPATVGAPVTFTAAVAGVAAGSNAPTGGVLFLIDGQPKATAAVHNGTASLTTSSLSLGAHTVQAQYAGDVNFDAGSATLSPDEQIDPAPPPPPAPPAAPPPAAAPAAGGATTRLDLLAVGSGPGGPPRVEVFDGDGNLRLNFLAFDAGFLGGVRVATGDVNGDGIDDVICGAGPGADPHVVVFDGVTGQLIRSFDAYDAGFHGGVFVGAGDVNGDGLADIVTGAGPGAGPHVKVFDGATGAEVRSFFAFDAGFHGGVSVRAGDVNGDGRGDIVVGAGPGAPGGHVAVFSGKDGSLLASFFAFDQSFTGGVFVGLCDVNNDGLPDITVGPASAAGQAQELVKVFDATDHSLLLSLDPFPGTTGGVRVAAVIKKGRILVTATGPGTSPRVLFFNPDGSPDREVPVFSPGFQGGAFVG
jgi:hypothetical protein